MEHRRVGGIRILPVGLAGDDDADRRLLCLHGANLNRRGVGAQQLALAALVGREEERVVHLARRMAGREVERGEIVVVGLDVGTFGDREAHIGEDRGDFVDDLADRMDAAPFGGRLAHRQRHIHLLGGEPCLDGGVAQIGLAGGDGICDAGLQAVDGRPCRLAFLRAHRSQRLQPLRDRALLAERRHAHRLDRGLVAGRFDLGHQRGLECFQVAHLFGHFCRVLSANKEKPAPALPARVSQYQFSNAWEALVRL